MIDKKTGKQSELLKYRDLVLATIDYYIENKLVQIETVNFDSNDHFKELKKQAEEHFQKGRLTKLKQWFSDLTEMQVETGDFIFNKYLLDKTKYDIDILQSYFQRVDKLIAKGKITTEKQFYELNTMVNKLCQTESIDKERIELLNNLLADYEQRKSKKNKNRMQNDDFS